MATIFLSYNRQSRDIAGSLGADLRDLGHTVWFDQQLSGGQAWWDQILEKVRGCDLFVFVLDPAALASTACKREYRYAAGLGKPRLPVLVADGVSTNLLPPELSEIQFVDYRTRDHKAALELVKAMAVVPAPKPLPDPLPLPPPVPISYLGNLTTEIEAEGELSYEKQTRLLLELKGGLKDPTTFRDARTLLERLRKRPDLRATVAEAIDELLGTPPRATTPLTGSLSTNNLAGETWSGLSGASPSGGINQTSTGKATGTVAGDARSTSGELGGAGNARGNQSGNFNPPPPPGQELKNDPLAIASLVLGVIPCTCIPSLLAVIFGFMALSRINASPQQLKGRALAGWGIGLGILFTILNIIYGLAMGLHK